MHSSTHAVDIRIDTQWKVECRVERNRLEAELLSDCETNDFRKQRE